VDRVTLEPGRGLPGCGVFVYGLERESDGSLVGARFFSVLFMPLVPLGRVRLVATADCGESETSGFAARTEGRVPFAFTVRLWLLSLGLVALALAPASYVLPRVHETGVWPGLRLVLASLVPLVVLALADLSVKRLARLELQTG